MTDRKPQAQEPVSLAVIASADWCAVAGVSFLQSVLPSTNPRKVVALAEMAKVLETECPDLVVLAVPNRERAHTDLLYELHTRWPDQPLGVVSSDHFPETARAAREVAARVYVTTGCAAGVIRLAMDSAVAGTPFFTDESAAPPSPVGGLPSDVEGRLTKLTPRERDVMSLLGRGHSNRDIAHALDLREGTVRIYVHRVIRQLGLRNRVDVALCASRLNGHAG